jgi:hypothetical protein
LPSIGIKSMKIYNVYAISDWPENMGEKIVVYREKQFESEEQAELAGASQYPDLEIVVVEAAE